MASPTLQHISKQYLLNHFASRHFIDSKTRRQFQQSFVCWSASSLLAIIIGAILAYVMSSRHPSVGYGRGRALNVSDAIYTCEDSSDDIREAIDYYQDPCENFHAFVCGQHVGNKRHASSIVDMLRDNLMSGTVPPGGQTAMQKVRAFFVSCLGASFSNETVKRNYDTFSRLVEPASHWSEIVSSSDVLDLVARLSLRWGISTFLSMSIDPSGSLVIRPGKPLSAVLPDGDLRVAVETLKDLLNATDWALADVKAVDAKLSLLTKQIVQDVKVPFSKLSETSDLSLSHWMDVVNAHVPVGKQVTSDTMIVVPGLETVQKAVRIALDIRDLKLFRIYTLLQAILPEDVVTASNGQKEETADSKARRCFTLARRLFGVIWKDVVVKSIVLPETLSDVQFMTTAMVVSLKKLLRRSRLFSTGGALTAVLDTIDRTQVDLPRVRSDVVLDVELTGLADLNATDLYANLLRTQRFLARRPGLQIGGPDPEVPRVSYRGGAIEVAAASLKAPEVCYGPPKILNYASVGFSIAEELLNAVDWPPVSRDNFSAARLNDLYSCTSKLAKRLGENDVTHWNLRKVVRLRTVFEAVTEAAKLEMNRIDRGELLPAVVQTFLAAYCRRWCNVTSPGGFGGQFKCNVALMGQSQFLNLFRCEEDQQMAPKHRCRVFS